MDQVSTFTMNFHLFIQDMRLFYGHILVVQIFEERVWWTLSLDLDPFIGNRNGRLTWGYKDYSREARNIQLIKDPNGLTPVLTATLKDCEGNDRDSGIDLAQCIGIHNHALVCRPDQRYWTEPVRNDLRGITHFRFML
ncbi:CVNH domain-containing protein [Fusarium sp. LHS14.1]|nr:CVNH domain-containing protein [Fusarium sp. LHS14.1]